MRILVLGGSVFLSKAVATEAVGARARGHLRDRGRSGPVPDGARPWCGTGRTPYRTSSRPTTSTPSSTWPDSRRGCGRRWPRVPAAHWVFVSTVNVYSDDADARPGVDGSRSRRDSTTTSTSSEDPEAYGPMKVACEQIVRDGAASCDGDPARADRRPRRPDRPVHLLAGAAGRGWRGAGRRPTRRTDLQVIDVRDLAAWIVACAETARRVTTTASAR